MTALYQTEKIRAVEQWAASRELQLMERAGHAAADWISANYSPASTRILVLAGPGNNGGDGLILARVLTDRHFDIKVLRAYPEKQYSGDAQRAFHDLNESCLNPDDFLPALAQAHLIVDAIYGIGISRNLDDQTQDMARQIGASGKPVISLDVPTGVNADTGFVYPGAIKASTTLTFIADKPGLHTGAALNHCGAVHVLKLGICIEDHYPSVCELNQPQALLPHLKRPSDSHKGKFGTISILGGSEGMTGAAILSARSALHSGAGKIRLVLLNQQTFSHDSVYPEIMCLHPRQLLADQDGTHYVAGPGLGQTEQARRLLSNVLQHQKPLLLDADALNLIALDIELQLQLQQRPSDQTIITPHPLEAARLLGCTSAEVQADRIHHAQLLAQKFACIVILKGAGSIICASNGNTFINPTGSAALSAAGQGDILAGSITALWAQGLSALEAAQLGVYAHGLAGEHWQSRFHNGIGLTSLETMQGIRQIINA